MFELFLREVEMERFYKFEGISVYFSLRNFLSSITPLLLAAKDGSHFSA